MSKELFVFLDNIRPIVLLKNNFYYFLKAHTVPTCDIYLLFKSGYDFDTKVFRFLKPYIGLRVQYMLVSIVQESVSNMDMALILKCPYFITNSDTLSHN